MSIKTVPNQKVVIVRKEKCNKENYYAVINLKAMEAAAVDLDAGAFKLWIYMSKNQNGYEFALSSKAAEGNFGLKKKQYDNAVKQLTDKGYLTLTGGNHYTFNEVPIIQEKKEKNKNEEFEEVSGEDKIPRCTKKEQRVVPKGNNHVVPKRNNVLYQKDTRNITYNTLNNTNNTLAVLDNPKEGQGQGQGLKVKSKVYSMEDMEFMEFEKECYIKSGLSEIEATNKAAAALIVQPSTMAI